MSSVRRFVEEDIPRVADLHRRIFVTGEATSGWIDSYRRYFSTVFLNTFLGHGNDAPASLVYESRGRILGFLGVMPRRMLFKGKPILMAVCSQFVVEPGQRGQVGLQILKRCLEGPQDLSMTDDAADNTRKIWEWCGGGTVLPHSIHWIRPLRPAQALLAYLGQGKSFASWTRASVPFARILDGVVTRLAPAAFRLAPPRGSREELDEATLLACLPEFAGGRSLGPDYDRRSIEWAMERASRRTDHGRFRKLLVRDETQDVSGWFVYSVSRGGIGEVLQIAAKAPATSQVLNHLFDDAAQQGAIALSGRLEPALAPELSEKHCLLYRGERWTLIHSKRNELLYAIQRGDAFLTRLEGEWCLRFP
jgi:hypothetical protein